MEIRMKTRRLSMHGGFDARGLHSFSIVIQCVQCTLLYTYVRATYMYIFPHTRSACVRRCWWWKLMPFASIAITTYTFFVSGFFPIYSLARSFVCSFDRLVCFLFGWHFIFWCLRFRVTHNFDGLLFSAAGQTDTVETYHAKCSTRTHLLTTPNGISSVQFSQLHQSYFTTSMCPFSNFGGWKSFC